MKTNLGRVAAIGLALSFACQWVQAAVTSEARAQAFMQTCAGPCSVNEAFFFNEALWLSHGQGSSPVSTAGFYPTPNGPTQYAYANADLPNSKLHVVASGRSDSTYTRLYSAVVASIGDTFSVNGAGQSRLSVDVTGSLQTFNNPPDYYLSVAIQLLQPGSLDAYSRGDYDNVITLASSFAELGGSNWGSPSSLTLPGVAELVFQTPSTPFEWSVTFAAIYTMTDSQSINIDLGHTLVVKFDAPTGATVASASGYLPEATGWVSPVPEPGSALLLLAGLPLLARRAGRRERD